MKPKIAVFVHQPMCSIQSNNGIINALSDYYNFKIFTKQTVEENFFDDVDIICFPGGFGNSDSFDYLMKANGKRIKQFVKNGGKYLGVCMGAYWTGKHYFDILDDVEPVQYYKRETSDTKRPHTKNMPVVWNGEPMRMFFNDGCALIGDSYKFQTVATYANGDPMAIVQNNIGLIGCHPESEKFWYDSYTWMKDKWHNGDHHRLLLDFVDNLYLKK
jgi:glutamine amidotransferase-like uncharacterized protein